MRGEKLNKDFPYYIDHKRIDVACVTDHPDSPRSVVFHARINATFASGALHWVVRDQRNSSYDNLIVAFDLATEEYRLVPLPGYRLKESWTKLVSVAQPKSFDYVKPVAYSKCGGLLLLEKFTSFCWHNLKTMVDKFPTFLWYDLKTKVVKDVRIEGTPGILFH